MKILKENTNNGLFPVSNAFVNEFLDRLSGNAVKTYIYLLYAFSEGIQVSVNLSSKKLRMSGDEFEQSLAELRDNGIITYEKGKILTLTAPENLHDRKLCALDNDFDEKTAENPETADEYDEIAKTVNREFFAGKMTYAWYDIIEKCKKEYGFLPETIYLLFGECKDKLSREYVKKVAENWYAKKVVNAGDVARVIEEFNVRVRYVEFVRKQLNFQRPFSESETTLIKSWLEAGITTEMLMVLLSDTNRVSAFTIGKIDAEVKEWIAAGLKNELQVKTFLDTKKSAKTSKKNDKKEPSGTNIAKGGHFNNERSFTDDFFEKLKNRDKKDGEL